ncbi:hypothetical protein LX36DRAFT_684401 [Colletotrichum falcatum]|nr:hypothetical protein LX36DRAFT_684401 [Colletotrichum falcatum]
MGRQYLLWFHGQPITLFDEDEFLPSLSSRDPELILALQALVLRFPPGSLTQQLSRRLDEKTREARQMVMNRVAEGRVELSTLQSLCLLSVFDFSSGNTTQSGVSLTLASHLAHSIPPSASPANAKERNYCLRSIFVLQHLQGCLVPAPLGPAPCCHLPEPLQHAAAPEKDISAVAADFCVVWRMARAYAASPVAPDSPPPWDARSDYARVLQCHHDMDGRAPQRFRFAANRIDRKSPAELAARRRFWMPFLFIQFVHEAVPCLLNHPFLLSLRLRHVRRTMPVHFIQQSFESLGRTAGWVVFFLDVLERAALEAPDPVVAHCVVVVATIHLQHSFVRDPALRGKAEAGFDKCVRFLTRTGTIWPCVANMADNLKKLRDSVVTEPTPDPGDGGPPKRSFSIDARLLRDLLIYDRAGRPDAGRDQSVFGATLRSDARDHHLLPTTTAAEDAADFDLVGSAGISAHKAVPDSAAVYAPEDEGAAPAPASLPGVAAPSFEDIFFEGAGPFGDLAGGFIEANDYGRAIDEWLYLDN